MYDKRVFRGNTHGKHQLKATEKNLTAAERDAIRIEELGEIKKAEMIRAKLMHYKRQRTKTSPYELNPGPLARIEVDLTFFLTE